MPFGPFYVGDKPAVVLAIQVIRAGVPIDLAPYNAATVLVEDPAGASVTWSGNITIDNVADVVNVAFGATSNFATPGVYTMRVRLTSAGGAVETSQPVLIVVYPATATGTWATMAEVFAITNAEVTEAQLSDAQRVIDIYAGRTYDLAAKLGSRDRFWLKQACAHQAAWMPGQAGLGQRQQVQAFSQDGLTAQYAAEWNVSLAPMAARALKNLSWKGSRTVRTPGLGVPRGGIADFTGEASDQTHDWSPL